MRDSDGSQRSSGLRVAASVATRPRGGPQPGERL